MPEVLNHLYSGFMSAVMLVPAAVVARMRVARRTRSSTFCDEAIDEVEVGAHALAHDFGRDIDHVSVAHVAAVDDVGHLHARVEFVRLHLHREDGDLRRLHVVKDRGGHVVERAGREVFEDEGVPGTAALGKLGGKGSSDWLGGAVGDERDFLVGLDTQTGDHGGAGAGDEFRRVILRKQIPGGCGKACDCGAPSVGDARKRHVSI